MVNPLKHVGYITAYMHVRIVVFCERLCHARPDIAIMRDARQINGVRTRNALFFYTSTNLHVVLYLQFVFTCDTYAHNAI